MRKFLLLLAFLALAFSALGGLRVHPPLAIRGEAGLGEVAQGQGTAADPYIIEGLRIDAAGEPFGLSVENFGRPLVVRNLEIYGASVAAIKLQNARLVRIENVVLRGSGAGILIAGSEKVAVENAVITECPDGIRVIFSRELRFQNVHISKAATGIWFQGVQASVLKDSLITACGIGLLLELGSEGNTITGNVFADNHIHGRSEGRNSFDDGERGNFWSGFEAEDKNGDGILDEPYFIGPDSDRFPLATPPRA